MGAQRVGVAGPDVPAVTAYRVDEGPVHGGARRLRVAGQPLMSTSGIEESRNLVWMGGAVTAGPRPAWSAKIGRYEPGRRG